MYQDLSQPARRFRLFAALALALTTAPLRGQSPAAPTSTPEPAPTLREVVDEFGRTVRVPQVPSRIVSLAPSLTETVYALGAQDRLVGVTSFCDYPPEAQTKSKVGGVIDPNLEEIAALRPDIVLLTKEANRIETVRALDTLGIPSYATDTHNVDEIIASTQKLADLLGVPEAGKSVTAGLQARLVALQAKLESVPPTRVLFIVWTEPLISVGKNTFLADALRKAGATSIVDSTQDWPHMSLEEVARLHPEYLVFAAGGADPGVRDLEALAERPGWRILDAVRSRHFAGISEAINRPAPRIVSAIEELARQLHPEVFLESPATREKAATPAPSRSDTPAATSPPPVVQDVLRSAQEIACVR